MLFQVGRFGLAGLVNTAVGFAVIMALDPVLGLPPALANAAGYAVGLTVGFVLNRRLVFRSDASVAGSGIRFVLAAAAAFALNQGVLYVGGLVLGAGRLPHIGAQVAAMLSYSALLFVLCRSWVFRDHPPAALPRP